MTERVKRKCQGCGQYDDHPHHTWGARIEDHVLVEESFHMDCCAARGCPTGHCPVILATAGGKKGLDLVSHIQAGGAQEAVTAWEQSQVPG